MNGVTIEAQQPLAFVQQANVVLFGSGIYTREIAKDKTILAQLELDPSKQVIGAQCSGTLLLATLGLLNGLPACTDLTTKPWVIEAGIDVLNQPFIANGNVATAGGCMSSQYLATWVISKIAGRSAAEAAIHYVAPVGEKDETVARSIAVVEPYIKR
jgi:transcriptional regulator GlxA family with amidase domain